MNSSKKKCLCFLLLSVSIVVVSCGVNRRTARLQKELEDTNRELASCESELGSKNQIGQRLMADMASLDQKITELTNKLETASASISKKQVILGELTSPDKTALAAADKSFQSGNQAKSLRHYKAIIRDFPQSKSDIARGRITELERLIHEQESASEIAENRTHFTSLNGDPIKGKLYSVDDSGIVFKTEAGNLTQRIPYSKLVEKEYVWHPKVTAWRSGSAEREEKKTEMQAQAERYGAQQAVIQAHNALYASSTMIRSKVFQATSDGLLLRDVWARGGFHGKKNEMRLEGEMILVTGFKGQYVDGSIFPSGEDTTKIFGFRDHAAAWKIGIYSYESVGAGIKTIKKFTVNPDQVR